MHLARQPIVSALGRIVGYELLFRPAGASIRDGGLATAHVAAKAFADPAFAGVLGPHPGYINVDAAFVESELVEFLPAHRIVLELLETTEFTPAVVERLRELKAKGYRLATDDYRGDRATIEPVLPLLDIVKVDLPFLDGRDPGDIARSLPGKTILAEKVETQAQFRQFRSAGYDLFQGYHFARPEIIGTTGGNGTRVAALAPLALLEQDADDTQIEDAIRRHPGLVGGLLRLVNAAASGLSKPIESLRQAQLHLGRRQIRLWLLLLVYVGSEGGDPSGNPLLQTAAVRAKTMESLAVGLGLSGERAFLTGMVSLFDVAVGMPIGDIASRLGLVGEIVSALAGEPGELGSLLGLARALEGDDRTQIDLALTSLPALRADDLHLATLDALRWSGSLV